MPKQVDHDARREELATALWRLVMRDGIEAASLRRVATEAGWSAGSLRHYFPTQSELLQFAMELVALRVTQRIDELPLPRSGTAAAVELLSQVLPLDPERRAEMQVWLAFTSRSFVDARLRDLRSRAHAGLRALCAEAIDMLGVRPTTEDAERLHAFVDGLALHAILAPEVTTSERQVTLLTAELDRIRTRRRRRG